MIGNSKSIRIQMIETQTIKLDQKYLTKIRSLDLGANVHNWRKILCMASWSHLRKINLKYCDIGETGLKLLLTRQLNCLIELRLDGNPIGSGVKLLTKIDFHQLKHLNLNSCGLGEEGAKHLTKGYCPALWYLSLHNNNINESGCQQLMLMGGHDVQQLVLATADHAASNRIEPIIILNWVASSVQDETLGECIKNKYFRTQLGFIYANKFNLSFNQHNQ